MDRTVAFARINAAILINAVSQAAGTVVSSGLDLSGYEGDVAIIQQTGAITGTLDGKIQGSIDNSAWNDLLTAADGLIGPQVTAANKVQSVTVDVRSLRTSAGQCRFLRYSGAIVTGPVLISVVLVGPKKYES